ncbi:flavoprotein [Actinacidiphila glaucinigra]|uniref:flavoprotein n=1 Tax=Actinacidiphila glaucinigra TaxID=235986 RepID=UPI0037AF3929
MASDTPPSQPRPVRGVLAVVGSAADGVETLREGLVLPAIARGWRVAVTLTPTAARWLRERDEIGRLRDVTGLPVRDRPRLPGESRPHPAADCCVLAPAAANTLAKLALGIADNQALTLLAEVLGTPHVPLVAVPAVTGATPATPPGPAISPPSARRASTSWPTRRHGPCRSRARSPADAAFPGPGSWTRWTASRPRDDGAHPSARGGAGPTALAGAGSPPA